MLNQIKLVEKGEVVIENTHFVLKGGEAIISTWLTGRWYFIHDVQLHEGS